MPKTPSRIDVIEEAARLVRTGDLNQALQTYEQLFAQDRSDWTVANALGDLYLRVNRTEQGVTHFMEVAEQVARDGYTAKARAIYRKVLRAQPNNELARARVVELENQHLIESSPFMQRMLDTARLSHAAAVKQKSDEEAPANPEPAASPSSDSETLAVPADPEPQPVSPLIPQSDTAAPTSAQAAVAPAIAEAPPTVPADAELQVASGAIPSAERFMSTEPEPAAPVQSSVPECVEPAPPVAAVQEPNEPEEEPVEHVRAAADERALPVSLVTEELSIVTNSGANVQDEWSSINFEIETTEEGGLAEVAPLPLEEPHEDAHEDPELLSPLPVDAAEPVDADESSAVPRELLDDWFALNAGNATLQVDEEEEGEGTAQHDQKSGRIRDFHDVEHDVRLVTAKGDFDAAASVLEDYLQESPHDVAALEALIDVGVEGGLDQLCSAQLRLADACLLTGRLTQARNVAVDLVARYPDDSRCHEVMARVRESAAEPIAQVADNAALEGDAETIEEQEAPHSIHMRLILDALGPDEPVVDVEMPTGDSNADDTFEEIRIAILEDLAAAAEERLATAGRLIDDGEFQQAIPLLEEAICVPHLRHTGGARLAHAYRESGDCLKALDCLERAAERPPVNEESGHILAYELALTLEAMGDRQQALGVYRELLAEVGPSFRDIAARAERLMAA